MNERVAGRRRVDLKMLVGSGHRIALFTLPFAIVGLIANVIDSALFDVGGPPATLRTISIVVLSVGVTIWLWSAFLILTNVPRGRLITTGPYSVVKHPLYTAVALLVLPPVGIFFNSWLGAAIGLVMYVGSRSYAPTEEAMLSKLFGDAWKQYLDSVKVPWL